MDKYKFINITIFTHFNII